MPDLKRSALNILLVEDHELVGQAISRYLREKGGHRVPVIARTAEQALELLETVDFDLALIDVSLPRMSGIDLVHRLEQENKGIPCLMLSGHMDNLYVRRSLHVGARGYILKGDSDAILEGIRRVMEGEIYLSQELR